VEGSSNTVWFCDVTNALLPLLPGSDPTPPTTSAAVTSTTQVPLTTEPGLISRGVCIDADFENPNGVELLKGRIALEADNVIVEWTVKGKPDVTADGYSLNPVRPSVAGNSLYVFIFPTGTQINVVVNGNSVDLSKVSKFSVANNLATLSFPAQYARYFYANNLDEPFKLESLNQPGLGWYFSAGSNLYKDSDYCGTF
jgi:hypothetical protein